MSLGRKASQILLISLGEGLTFLVILYFFRALHLLQRLLFEQIILSVLVTTALALVLPYAIKNSQLGLVKRLRGFHYKYLACLIAGAIFFTSTSTILNIDRSRSFYILSWINKNLVTLKGSEYDLSSVKSSEKLNVDGISMRILEQQNRGIIIKNGEKFKLSSKGKFTLEVANILARVYSLNGWYENNH